MYSDDNIERNLHVYYKKKSKVAKIGQNSQIQGRKFGLFGNFTSILYHWSDVLTYIQFKNIPQMLRNAFLAMIRLFLLGR